MERHSYTFITLIIDSDDPIYVINRRVWRAYMNSDPRILCLFLRNDPTCPAEGRLDLSSNTLFVQGTENLIPGILNKTIAGFEYCLRNFTFDYIIRTNISSFYVLPNLHKYVLPTLPRNNYYAGFQGRDRQDIPFASGAGFFVSPDIVRLLVDQRAHLSAIILDDLSIGHYLHTQGIPVLHLQRFDFTNETNISESHDVARIEEAIHCNTYHFRIKNMHDRSRFDQHYMRLLLNVYYNIELPQ